MESAGRNSFNPSKQLKEEFVSNLTGSSMLEIAVLSTIFPVVILLRHSFSSYGSPEKGSTFASFEAGTCLEVCFCVYYVECPVCKVVPSKKSDKIGASRSWTSFMATLTTDFLFIVFPILLSLTVLADWIYLWALLLMLIPASFTVFKRSDSSLPSEGTLDTIRTDVSLYRVCLMVVTCLCILAVDFRVFPRRYAKTETYGTSLMDLGVGSFVLANAFVSRQARNASFLNLQSALSTTSPLILLGFGRLVSTAGVNYQIHVGEYGVHWNFFFTLAAVAVLSSLINVPPQYCGILGSLVLVGYQVCLNNGLNTYLLSSDRGSSIISQNKEGVFSILGYWGMYLLGVNLGNYLFFKDQLSSNIQRKAWTRRRVWIFAVLFWLLAILLDKHVERVSRRMCNLSYVIMVVAVNLQWLAVLMLSDYVPGSRSSVLEDAFNQNLLATFLVANVLTGVVNLSFDTLFASTTTSLLILSAYAYVLSVVAGSLNFYGVRSKFWKFSGLRRDSFLPLSYIFVIFNEREDLRLLISKAIEVTLMGEGE